MYVSSALFEYAHRSDPSPSKILIENKTIERCIRGRCAIVTHGPPSPHPEEDGVCTSDGPNAVLNLRKVVHRIEQCRRRGLLPARHTSKRSRASQSNADGFSGAMHLYPPSSDYVSHNTLPPLHASQPQFYPSLLCPRSTHFGPSCGRAASISAPVSLLDHPRSLTTAHRVSKPCTP